MRKTTVFLGLFVTFGAGCELVNPNVEPVVVGLGSTCGGANICRPGLLCVTGKCAARGNTPEDGTCVVSEECAPTLACSPTQKCVPAGTAKDGEECGSPTACERGLTCNLNGFSGTCGKQGAVDLGGACTTGSDCFSGLFCSAGKCLTAGQAAASGKEETCPKDNALEGKFRAYFQVPREGTKLPDFFRLPFPNDIRKKSDGTLDLADFPVPGPGIIGVDLVDLYAKALSKEFAGFSTVPSVTFRFSGPLDFGTVNGNGDAWTINWVELGTGRGLGFSYQWSTGRGRYICQNVLSVGPPLGATLEAGKTYAVILKRGIKNEAGDDAGQDPDFAAVIGEDVPSDPALAAAHTAYAPLRKFLKDKAISVDTVAAAAVFTTQDPLASMRKVHAAIQKAPEPAIHDVTVCKAGVKSPCEDPADPSRSCGEENADFTEIHARVDLPIFQQGTAPYEKDGGEITYDAEGNAKIIRTEPVCTAFAIPKGATMPEAGWPIVFYAHGTGGNFRSAIREGVARSLVKASPGSGDPVRFVVVGFDQVQHSERRGASKRSSNELVFNVLNPHAARDNFLQGGADGMAYGRLLSTLDIGSDVGRIKADPGQIHFYGHSQGGTSGPITLAFPGPFRSAVLSGAGGYLVESLLGKTNPVNIAVGMQIALLEPKAMGPFHPVLSLFQTYFDRSDPLNYGPAITNLRDGAEGARHVHVFQTYGLGETFTPVKTIQALGFSMGVELANDPALEEFGMRKIPSPVKGNGVSGKVTAVMQQFRPDGYDGHFVALRDADGKRRVAAFFASGVVDPKGIPTLIP